MKISKKQLEQLIKEAVAETLNKAPKKGFYVWKVSHGGWSSKDSYFTSKPSTQQILDANEDLSFNYNAEKDGSHKKMVMGEVELEKVFVTTNDAL